MAYSNPSPAQYEDIIELFTTYLHIFRWLTTGWTCASLDAVHTNRYTEIPNQSHQKVNTIWIREKNHHRWLELFSHLRLWMCFCSTFSVKPHPFAIFGTCVVFGAAAARSNSESKLRYIWLWCVNHRAIYCDLIDFLCGKQLKRNSDVHDCER